MNTLRSDTLPRLALVDFALAYVRAGYKVFPLEPNSKTPLGQLVPRGFLDATTDEATIREWWRQYPNANIGIACLSSGILVIDPDRHTPDVDGIANLEKLSAANGGIPKCPIQLTITNGGKHLIFKHPQDVNIKPDLAPGINIKSKGYIVAAPSTVEGGTYRWEDPEYSLLNTPQSKLPELPEWLLRSLAKPAYAKGKVSNQAIIDDSEWNHKRGIKFLKSLGETQEGGRNHAAFKAACELRDYGMSEGIVMKLIEQHMELIPPLPQNELEKTVANAYQHAQNTQGSKHPDVLFSHELEDTGASNWPVLPKAALYGLAGEVVNAATENSEADRAAVLLTFLTWLGAAAGNSVYTPIGDTRHYPRLFCTIVGASSRARKGTSKGPIEKIFQAVEKNISLAPLATSNGPLSSGEGIIYAVRDASDKRNKKEGNIEDEGVRDKRLLVLEGEFGAPLKALQREGNTLSAILRTAWDGGNIQPLTKSNRIKVTDPHICIVAHITRGELKQLLQTGDLWNGLANRFLWVCAKRQKLVPNPKPMDSEVVQNLANKLAEVLKVVQTFGAVSFLADAQEAWDRLYPTISHDEPGTFGVVTARAEAHVKRLALIYALLDGTDTIGLNHLKAALAVWGYCRDSARYVFGETATNTEAGRILEALTNGDKSQTELNNLFDGHLSSDKLGSILRDLEANGRILKRQEKRHRGKGTTYWQLNLDFTSGADFAELMAGLGI